MIDMKEKSAELHSSSMSTIEEFFGYQPTLEFNTEHDEAASSNMLQDQIAFLPYTS